MQRRSYYKKFEYKGNYYMLSREECEEIYIDELDISKELKEKIFLRASYIHELVTAYDVLRFNPDFKGNICPCAGYRHIGKNIFESSFKEIWESYAYLKRIPATEENRCIHCQSRFFCRVCPAEQELKTGKLESITPEICEFAHVKKMYYKDRMSLETILKVMGAK